MGQRRYRAKVEVAVVGRIGLSPSCKHSATLKRRTFSGALFLLWNLGYKEKLQPLSCLSVICNIFLWSAPIAFRRVALETPEWTSRDSNHHRQSISAGKTNAIPTEPLGRLSVICNKIFQCQTQVLNRTMEH